MAENCNEVVIEWVRGRNYVGITACARSPWTGKIEELAKKYPEEVKIMARNPDGSIFAHAPVSYIRVRHPKKISEAQRQASSERLKKYRDKKKSQTYDDEFIFE